MSPGKTGQEDLVLIFSVINLLLPSLLQNLQAQDSRAVGILKDKSLYLLVQIYQSTIGINISLFYNDLIETLNVSTILT